MTDVIRLELPLPPSMNTYWRRGPNRSPKAKFAVVTHISAAGRQFRRHVKLVWLARAGRRELKGPLYVFGALFPPTLASDTDNRIKPTLDALEHAGVYKNDRQVVDVEFYRAGTVGRANEGCLLVEIGPYEWTNQSVAGFKAAAGWE